MPRKPRAKRKPESKRAKMPPPLLTYECLCKSCGANFRFASPVKPAYCIACKSEDLNVMVCPEGTAGPYGFSFQFSGEAMGDLFTRIIEMMMGDPVIREHAGFPPPPPPARPASMSRHEAALFLAVHSCTPKDYILDSTAAMEQAYKRAARKLHPDTGGSHDLFVKLQEARAVLSH